MQRKNFSDTPNDTADINAHCFLRHGRGNGGPFYLYQCSGARNAQESGLSGESGTSSRNTVKKSHNVSGRG